MEPFLYNGDVPGIDAFLRSLSPAERTEARRWFKSPRRLAGSLHDKVAAKARENGRNPHEIIPGAQGAFALCVLHLLGPSEAGRFMPWDGLGSGRYVTDQDSHRMKRVPNSAIPHITEFARAADPAWMSAFAEAAANCRPGFGRFTPQTIIALVLRDGLVHHGLPHPTGPHFLQHFHAGIDDLASDPFMPQVLYDHIDLCDVATWTGMSAEVASLVDSGKVDRDTVLDHIFHALTSPRRPTAQRVLLETIEALDVPAEEYPGGLDYLLGVMSTCDRVVYGRLLGPALALAKEDEQSLELANLVISRPEKMAKSRLLKAVTTDSRLTRGATIEILGLLASEADTVLARKAAAARAKLTPTDLHSTPPESSPLGLWDHEVAGGRLDTLALFQRLAIPQRTPWDAPARSWHQVIGDHEFTVRHAVRAFEGLFLSGHLQESWPWALSTAESWLMLGRRPSVLIEFIRKLAEYAPEVPDPRMPPALDEVALRPSQTKAVTEARRLAARLARVDEQEYPAWRQAQLVQPRGLWDRSADTEPTPLAHRLGDLLHDRDLFMKQLDGVTPADLASFTVSSRRTEELLLATFVASANRHGTSVRANVPSVRPNRVPVSEVLSILRLWADGGLTMDAFWNNDLKLAASRFRDLPTTILELFAAESMLAAEHTPTLLSTPSWSDGTVEFADLERRLRACHGTQVGPLDVLLALHRLRPTPTEARIDGPVVRTVPALTSPDSDESWDVVAMVNTWVAGGGLPALDVEVQYGAQPGGGVRIIDHTVDPMPFVLSRAYRRAGLDKPSNLATLDQMFLAPRWGDRVGAPARQWHYTVADFDIGEPLGEVSTMTLAAGNELGPEMWRFVRQGRLDPDIFAHHATQRLLSAQGRRGQPDFVEPWVRSLVYAFEGGDLKWAWPLATAVARSMSHEPALAAAAGRFDALLNAYMCEVPAAVRGEETH